MSAVAGFDPKAHGLPEGAILDRDEDAPELFAVWTLGDDGDILGTGATAEEAIADAWEAVHGAEVDAAADTQRDPGVRS